MGEARAIAPYSVRQLPRRAPGTHSVQFFSRAIEPCPGCVAVGHRRHDCPNGCTLVAEDRWVTIKGPWTAQACEAYAQRQRELWSGSQQYRVVERAS